MAKVEVTPELADLIKTIRLQNKITSKEVASIIDRSPSYFSKIENGGIKTILTSELDKIIDVIVHGESAFDDKITEVVKTLAIKYTSDEIEKQVWAVNYDTVQRRIPIPPELVDNLNHRISDKNMTTLYLANRINANEEVPSEFRNDPLYGFNEWYIYGEKGENRQFIKMNISTDTIDNILNKRITSANYVTILAISYYLSKTEVYGDRTNISEGESDDLMRAVREYFKNYKFYSLSEKNRLLHQALTEQEREQILTSFDKNNLKLINDMLQGFQVFSELNVEFVNQQIKKFVDNLHWDSGFMLNLIGSNFSELKGMSFTLKKELLLEMRKVIEKYNSLPEEKKRMENYET